MGIYKRKGEATEVWYLRYRDFDGKLVRKSSGTTNKAVAQAMLAAAEALGAQLIAVGASGHSPLQEFFLGSTTQRLLNSCPCTLFVHQ